MKDIECLRKYLQMENIVIILLFLNTDQILENKSFNIGPVFSIDKLLLN